jgi:two-component system, response regulator
VQSQKQEKAQLFIFIYQNNTVTQSDRRSVAFRDVGISFFRFSKCHRASVASSYSNIMKKKSVILIADDDSDDCYLIRLAFEDCKIDNPIVFFKNGLEVVDYINKQETMGQKSVGLIILDLNMPKMSGKETLSSLKSNPFWRKIPVVVMTTSKAKEDVNECYDLGANSFISKPTSYAGLNDAVETIAKLWLNYANLPV